MAMPLVLFEYTERVLACLCSLLVSTELVLRNAIIMVHKEDSRKAFINELFSCAMTKLTTPDRWWSKETIAVVTGGNKGIGYEIVKGLAEHGVTTILTARDEQRGLEAVKSLKQKNGLDVFFHKLDVTSSGSVEQFAEWLKQEFGGLDILVNNAGISGHSPDRQCTAAEKVEIAKAVFETNYYGVRRVTEQLIPLMKPSAAGSRIINMSSGTSRLDNLRNEALQKQISDVEKLTTEAIEGFVASYLEDVRNERVVEKGWPGFFSSYDYCVSKVILNAYTRMLARDLSSRPEGHQIYVNCMCPGLTGTDMTFKNGHPPEVGADTAIWLALLPASESSTGKFFVKRTEVGFKELPFYLHDIFAFSLQEFEACTRGEFPQSSILAAAPK